MSSFVLKSKHETERDEQYGRVITIKRFDVAIAPIDGETFMRRIHGFHDVLIRKLKKLKLIVELKST